MTPAQPIQQNASPDPAAQPQQAPAPQDDSNLPDENESIGGGSIKLQNAFSLLNERVRELFDHSGVRRAFTVPYIEGQQMDEHVNAVGLAAAQSGGLTNNLLTTAHHSGGKGYGSGDGHTVGHSSEALRNTIITKDNPQAIAAIKACRSLLNKISSLLGDEDPAVKTAKSQLNIIGKNQGAGMNCLDFAVGLIQTTSAPIQAVARAHSGIKEGGHGPQLRAPVAAPQEQE